MALRTYIVVVSAVDRNDHCKSATRVLWGRGALDRRDRLEWYPGARVVDYRDIESVPLVRNPGGISMYADLEAEVSQRSDFLRPGDVALSIPSHNDGRRTIMRDTESE